MDKYWLVLIVAVATSLSLKPSIGYAQPQYYVDIREFITQTASGKMLCESAGDKLCMQGSWNQYGEFTYYYSNGIIDYIARSSTSQYFVGSVRGYSGYPSGTGSDLYRCFANYNDYCRAPPDGQYPPQSVPMIFYAPLLPASADLSTQNSDGSANGPVSGSISITAGYQIFSVIYMDPRTCVQTFAGNLAHQVFVSYVASVGFGGGIGYRDALVIDEVEGNLGNGQFYPDHIERYYYVLGLGRVKESSAQYDGVGQYNRPLGGASVRNQIQTSTLPPPPVFCAQGTVAFN